MADMGHDRELSFEEEAPFAPPAPENRGISDEVVGESVQSR